MFNPLTKEYYITGENVRQDDVKDELFVATRDVSLGMIQLIKDDIVRFNGKSITVRRADAHEETNHLAAFEILTRRKWLIPFKPPNNKISNFLNGIKIKFIK